MKTEINSINFNAKFIKQTTITRNYAGKYEDFPVNFIEFNEKDPTDFKSLNDLKEDWEYYSYNFSTFLNSIMNNIEYRLKNNKKSEQIYAITTQNNNFDKINSKEVLGIVEFKNGKDYNFIEYLQVDPKLLPRYNNKREFLGIGSAIIKNLQHLTDKSIFVDSSKSARKFYEKNGFVSASPVENTYIWKKTDIK